MNATVPTPLPPAGRSEAEGMCMRFDLTADQRLLLASQLSSDMECAQFCRLHGWSPEKYRKVAQRARARLARLLDESTNQADAPVPPTVTRRIKRAGTHL